MQLKRPRHKQRSVELISIVQMDTVPLMFHRVFSVHINHSAHEIFKMDVFIEIFNGSCSVRAPRSFKKPSIIYKLKCFSKSKWKKKASTNRPVSAEKTQLNNLWNWNPVRDVSVDAEDDTKIKRNILFSFIACFVFSAGSVFNTELLSLTATLVLKQRLRGFYRCSFTVLLKGSVWMTSRVSWRMSGLMRAGWVEPNVVRSMMSLVICWEAITAGRLSGSYQRVISTDQCTCLSSNMISFNTQLSSGRWRTIPSNRKLHCSLRVALVGCTTLETNITYET